MSGSPRRPSAGGRAPDPARIIAAAPDAILTKTTEGIVTSWNAAAERLYGYTAEEMVGQHIARIIPQDRMDELAAILARAASGESVEPLETERIAKDGRRVRISLALAPILADDGRVDGICAIARDLTAQVRAEEELHRTSEQLRAIVEASPVITKILGVDGVVRYWSPAASAILGWTPDEVLGQPSPAIAPEEADRHRAFLAQVARGETVSGLESVRRRKDGSLVEVLVYGAPLRSASGAVVGVVELLADVTAHRVVERQLLQAQKLEGIGRLAGGVAHDFNNVLTAIAGHAELMLMDGADPDAPEVHARAIRDAAHRGAGLTAQLLAFSRQQTLEPKPIDLSAAVRSAEGLLRPLIGETIELQVVTRERAGHVLADPTQLQQVILNLVVNARDAMPDGGRLTVETDSAEFSEAYASEHFEVAPGRYAVLVVSDTGIGMDRETRQHIFEPFFTTKPVGEGTGLGLATTYGIVRQSNGHIWLYSEPGIGTTFKIYFPLVTAAGEPIESAPAPAVGTGVGTILLVEDEDEVREIERRLLQRVGYRVLATGDGAEALTMARHEGLRAIDLVVTDVVMPRSSGAKLAEELRRDRPDLPVLFVSGYAEETLSRDEPLPPHTAFLAKPFTPSALAAAVRGLLREGAAVVESAGGPEATAD